MPSSSAAVTHAVGVIAVTLERSGRINHDAATAGKVRPQLRDEIAVAVKGCRAFGGRPCEASAERCCLGTGPACDHQCHLGFIIKQLREASAEHTVSADDQNLQLRRLGLRCGEQL